MAANHDTRAREFAIGVNDGVGVADGALGEGAGALFGAGLVLAAERVWWIRTGICFLRATRLSGACFPKILMQRNCA